MAVAITTAMQNQIAQNYIAILGRNPDPAGFAFWVQTYADANATPAALIAITNGFGNSAEFKATYASDTTEVAVGKLYQNVLLRAADAGGLAYWTNYANGLISSGQTISNAYAQTGAQMIYNASSQGNSDAAGINARTATAVAAGTAAPTTTYTLTTANTVYQGGSGNDVFQGVIGTGATFITGDQIDGGGGTNTLRLNDGTTGGAATTVPTPTGLTLTNIQNLVVNADSASTSLAGNISGAPWSSVTSATFNAVTNSVVTGRSTTALTNNVSAAQAAGTSSIDGGSSQSGTFTGAALANAGTGSAITLGGITATTGAVNITVANTSSAVGAGHASAGGVITVNGGSSVTVNQSIASTAAAAATIRTGNVTVTLTQGQVDVNGTASTTAVTINQSAAAAAVASTTVGSAAIVAGATNVLDANRASTTAAGTITTVTLSNSGAAVVNSGALTTLNLAGTLTTVNAGTLGALTTAANTALTVNLNGAVSTGALTVDTDITTINITGSGTANTLADLVNASATAVNISGAVGVTVTANTLASTAIITSTNTAGTTLTQQLGNAQQFVGGDGADSISVAATTKAINMGGGNDVVIISTETLGTGGTLNGGAGTNTIVANTNGSTLSANGNITNFTTLRVAGGAAQGAHNATGFTALEVGLTGTNLAGAMSFTNVAAGTTLRYLATTGQTSAYTLANATGTSDVLNMTLSSAAAINIGTLTAAGIETVNITNTDTNTTAQQNTMALVATSATTITVTGNAGLAFTNDATNTRISVFNASGVVGAAADAANLAVSYTSVTTVANSATTTITGGSGNDTLVGAATADTIFGGLGNDSISGGTGADIIDGGAGTGDTYLTLTAQVAANIEGAGTGTSTGMVINLGSTALTAASVLGLTGQNVSGSLASVAAGSTAYLFNDALNTNSTVSTTLSNIENITLTGNGINYVVGSAGANVITGGTGRDYIVAGLGADTITGGTNADNINLTEATASIDTVVAALASSIVRSASTFAGAAVAAGDSLTYATGVAGAVDVISGFTAGTGGDILDLAVGTIAITLIGEDQTNLSAARNFYASGAYNATTGVFTIAADGAGADTMIVQGGAGVQDSLITNTSTVILIGVNSANLVAANFA